MKLRGIEFGNVFCASGARNFFGEGWPYHKPLKKLGLDYTGSTLITKTTTIDPREGNMPLRENSTQPVQRIPKCIVVKPLHGVALNSVGLSGPGLEWLIKQKIWHKIKTPFAISFMAVGTTHEDRIKEYQRFTKTLLQALVNFFAPVAIEINISCPNVHMHQCELIDEALDYLDIVAQLNAPIIVKINALLEQYQAAKLAKHQSCDALDVSNTIPYGQLAHIIPWETYFGKKSPLENLGGGGLSGKPLLPIVTEWIHGYRQKQDQATPIIGGGGILSCDDADVILRAGANAISLGCVSMLRPWRVQRIIKHVNAMLHSERVYESFGMPSPYRN